MKTRVEILKRAIELATQATFHDCSNPGICLACGNEQDGCEPDARNYECEACGMRVQPAVKPSTEKKMKTIITMRELRSTPVKNLTQEQCRKLLSHHHGKALDPMRRKAYLLKANPGKESAYFKPAEQVIIERAIEEGI